MCPPECVSYVEGVCWCLVCCWCLLTDIWVCLVYIVYIVYSCCLLLIISLQLITIIWKIKLWKTIFSLPYFFKRGGGWGSAFYMNWLITGKLTWLTYKKLWLPMDYYKQIMSSWKNMELHRLFVIDWLKPFPLFLTLVRSVWRMVLIKGFIDKFQYIINLIKGFTSLIRL